MYVLVSYFCVASPLWGSRLLLDRADFACYPTFRVHNLTVVGRKQLSEGEQRAWQMLSEGRKKEVKVSTRTTDRRTVLAGVCVSLVGPE